MRNLTKRDLVIRISNETGMIQEEVLNVIQRLMDHLTESVARGQVIEFRKFGTFWPELRKARVGRNPRHPEHDVPIPAHTVIKFKAGKELRNKVARLTQTMTDEPPVSQ